MVRNPSGAALAASAACPKMPHAQETEGDARDAHSRRPSGITDILIVSSNTTPVLYLSGLFQRNRWKIHRSRSLEDAVEFLQQHKAAVAICEETLPDGTWRDAARTLNSLPNGPMLVVIGSDRALSHEVLDSGGFDVLTRPLREAEVTWTVASAWHQWMKRFQGQETGGTRCSDA